MHPSRALAQATLAVLWLAVVPGCATVRQPDASAEEKRSFLFASVAEQAATGPKDCQLYADGLSMRLARSPYRYDVRTLYYCSLGAECHVVLKVDTGEEQFASDNGTFIEGHVEELGAFHLRRSRHLSWRKVPTREARLMLLAERYAPQP
jgi:hypothetical protein